MRRTVLRVHKIIAELKYPALAEINLAASVRPTGPINEPAARRYRPNANCQAEMQAGWTVLNCARVCVYV